MDFAPVLCAAGVGFDGKKKRSPAFLHEKGEALVFVNFRELALAIPPGMD